MCVATPTRMPDGLRGSSLPTSDSTDSVVPVIGHTATFADGRSRTDRATTLAYHELVQSGSAQIVSRCSHAAWSRRSGECRVTPKLKFMEVTLAPETLNCESACDRNVHHGHPSTPHPRWPRRPLAAARTVSFARLVGGSRIPEVCPTEEDHQKREHARLRSMTAVTRPRSAAAEIPVKVVAPEESFHVTVEESVCLVLVRPEPRDKEQRDAAASGFAHDEVQARGSVNRERRDALVFLAPGKQVCAEIESAVRQHLAWRSAVDDKNLGLPWQRVGLATGEVDTTHKGVERMRTNWTSALRPGHPADCGLFVLGALKTDGDGVRLVVRPGTKQARKGLCLVQFGPSTVRYGLDSRLHRAWSQVPFRVGDLWDSWTEPPCPLRLRDKSALVGVLESVVSDVGWHGQGFAPARGYEAAIGDFVGLAVPPGDYFGSVTDHLFLVFPQVDLTQTNREQDAAGTRSAASASPEAAADPAAASSDATGAGPSPVLQSALGTDALSSARYRGRDTADAHHLTGEETRRVADEMQRRIAAAKVSKGSRSPSMYMPKTHSSPANGWRAR